MNRSKIVIPIIQSISNSIIDSDTSTGLTIAVKLITAKILNKLEPIKLPIEIYLFLSLKLPLLTQPTLVQKYQVLLQSHQLLRLYSD